MLTPFHSKKLFTYGQKSVLTNSINIIIPPNKKCLKRDTGNLNEKTKKPESSSRKSRKISLLVHTSAMWHK